MDALNWHDQQRASGDRRKFPETYLAEAIKDVAPERARAIWQSEAERLIDQTDSKSYFEAGEYIKKILTLDERGGDIKPWLFSLRERHKRKKNFIKILDGVENSYLAPWGINKPK